VTEEVPAEEVEVSETEKVTEEVPAEEVEVSETEKVTEEAPAKEVENAETEKRPEKTDSDLSGLIKGIIRDIIKDGMSELEKVTAIHDYITYNLDYDYDNYLKNTLPSTSYSAYGALSTGRAVCSGYAEVFFELSKAVGLDVKYVSGEADNGSGKGPEGHAWNQVKVDGSWYNIDTCWDDPTWEGKDEDDHSSNGYGYCLVSDSVLYKDHMTDTAYVNKCPKSYEPAALCKALTKTNTYKPIVFAENAGEFEKAVSSMVSAGNNSFEILTEGNGTDYWEEIHAAIIKLKLPLWIKMQSNAKQAISSYVIEEKENVFIAGSPEELKKAVEAYSGKLDELELWFYDDAMNNDNQWDIVNKALYETGYCIEAESMTEVCCGMVQCHVKEPENIMTVDDLSEVAEYLGKNGIEALKEKNIWYKTKDADELSFGNRLAEELISSGYLVEYINITAKYDNVIKFMVPDARKVKYISGVQDLVSYVNNIGLENLIGQEFFIKNSQGRDALDVVYELFTEAQYPLGYSLSDRGSVIGVYPDQIYEGVYISVGEADLKNDIMDAKNKGILESAEFRLNDRTGKYSNESIQAVIASLNCNIIMDIIYYYEDYYHVLLGARTY